MKLLIPVLTLTASAALAAETAPVLPPVIKTLGAKPPAGAVVLFDGKSTAAWSNPWKVEKGAMVAGNGSTVTKDAFGDAYVHLEFSPPVMPEAKGQAKGNSGVYLQSLYEVQVLDSYGIASPGRGDCGAVYNVSAPLANACRPPGEWQTYDIIFRAPRFDEAGNKTQNARVTVFQNGILVQNNVEVPGGTTASPTIPESGKGPLLLQDHGNPVRYRNVWLLPLPAAGADHY
jgi:hypothetical protein